MSYERLESEGGLQWPCTDLEHPGSPFLHGWLWEEGLGGREPAPFSVTEHEGPKEELQRRRLMLWERFLKPITATVCPARALSKPERDVYTYW